MGRVASVVASVSVIVLGVALAVGGLVVLAEAGGFASGRTVSEQGPLGLWGSSSTSVDVPTLPWVGAFLAVAGAVVALMGLWGLLRAAGAPSGSPAT